MKYQKREIYKYKKTERKTRYTEKGEYVLLKHEIIKKTYGKEMNKKKT